MDRNRTGLLFGVERADALVRRKRTSPASNILACGSSRTSRTFPRRNILRSGCRPIRLGDAVPRLQWRHRVGFAPTSRDRRAEPVIASHRFERQLSGKYIAVARRAIGHDRLRLKAEATGASESRAPICRTLGTLAPLAPLAPLALWHPWHLPFCPPPRLAV